MIRKITNTGKENLGYIKNVDLDPSFEFVNEFALPNTYFVGSFLEETEKNKTSINSVLAVIQPGEQIIVLPGIYNESINVSQNITIHFCKNAKLTNDIGDLITISTDCVIAGEGVFENTGTNENFFTLKIINNAKVLFKGYEIKDDFGGGIYCDLAGEISLYLEHIFSKLNFIENSKIYIHSKIIYDLSVSNNSIVTVICKTFRSIVISGGKTLIDFKDNLQVNGTITPDGVNIRIYGGYLELFGGTLQNTLPSGYPIEIINGKIKLSHLKIDELDYTLTCINALGGVIILDNIVMTTGAVYSINGGVGSILKNYIGSVANRAINPNFIYGNNYLINLLTINSQVE